MNALGWIWYLIYFGGFAALMVFGIGSMIKHRKGKGSLSSNISQARNGQTLGYGMLIMAGLMLIIIIIAVIVR